MTSFLLLLALSIHMRMTQIYTLLQYFKMILQPRDARLASRVGTISSLNSDLERVTSRGEENLVNLNDSKPQFQILSLA